MKKGTKEQAQVYLELLPEEVKQRDYQNEWDYGPEETRLYNMRRWHAVFCKCDPNNSYGVYLGEHDGKYVIGVHNVGDIYDFNSCEIYDSLDECKNEWMIDEPDWESHNIGS
jgi:hypothetical protein